MYRIFIFIIAIALAIGCIGYGIAQARHINYLYRSGIQAPGTVIFSSHYGATVSWVDGNHMAHTLQTDYAVPYTSGTVFYNPANPNDAIMGGGGVWTYPMTMLALGFPFLLFILYTLWELLHAPNEVHTSSPPPRWLSDTRINRGKFLSWSIVLVIVAFGEAVAAELIFGDSLVSNIASLIAALLLFGGGFLITLFRLNDVSPEPQIALGKSGNAWFLQGWLLWLAPSSHGESSYHEISKNWSVVEHNAVRWAIFIAVFSIFFFGIYFLSGGGH